VADSGVQQYAGILAEIAPNPNYLTWVVLKGTPTMQAP
jgi:hypothetical protein